MKNVSKLGKLGAILTVVCALFLLSAPQGAYSQGSSAPAPEVVESQPNFPDFIVKPREETNPYDLSTITPDETIEFREGAGTLGTTEQRSSNNEINATLRKNKEEREKARKEAQEREAKENEAKAADTSQSTSATKPAAPSGSITPGVKGGLFRWVDKDGVLHATNDLGLVPIEYQLQAIEKSKSKNISPNKAE